MAAKVYLAKRLDIIRAEDSNWLTLKSLRELVRLADENGWGDSCLVSHGRVGGGEHPYVVGLNTARAIVVEGPK